MPRLGTVAPPLLFALVATACSSPSAPSTPSRTLTGIVSETAPTENVGIAAARVEVTAGADRGRATSTAADGSYSLSGLTGDADLTVTHADYLPRTVHVLASDGDRRDVALPPIPRQLSDVRAFPTSIAVHNPGEVSISQVTMYGFEGGDGLILEVVDGDIVLASTFVERSFPPEQTALSVRVDGGRVYTLRYRRYGAATLWSARLSFPN